MCGNTNFYDEPRCIRYGGDGSNCGFEYLPDPQEIGSGFMNMLLAPIMNLIFGVLLFVSIMVLMCCFCRLFSKGGILGRIISAKVTQLERQSGVVPPSANSRTEYAGTAENFA